MSYEKTVWVTGTTPISAANLNNMEDMIDTLADTEMDACAASVVSRSLETVYQNTSGKIQILIFQVECDSGDWFSVNLASSSPPALGAGSCRSYGSAAEKFTITIVVPPSWYYKPTAVSGTPTMASVWIFELH